MKRIVLLFVGLLLTPLLRTESQSAEQQLLLRISNLRGSIGLAPYVWNNQLAGAAVNHAQWLARTGTGSHRQSDGSLAADRARRYGYAGDRVHENYFMGTDAGIESAWRFWLNSAPHYSNLTSSRLSEIGIGRASSAGRTAYVLVFGHESGRGAAQAGSGSVSGGSGGGGQPAYVLGQDEVGNIRHEVQPGHTIGDIALIYGYTWDDIPAMLALNGMTSDDIRLLQPGSEFLVPPKAGTYTPTAAAPTETATGVETVMPATATPTSSRTASPATAAPTRVATRALRIEREPAQPTAPFIAGGAAESRQANSYLPLLLLGIAIVLQIGLIGGATFEFIRRAR